MPIRDPNNQASLVATGATWGATYMGYLNENSAGIMAICCIISTLVTIYTFIKSRK